jgi:hypothetical protein
MTFIVTLAAGAGEATLRVVRAFIDPDNYTRMEVLPQTPSSSTSNTSVAFGGITPPAPRAP